MPLWYSTTTEEHLSVRNNSGVFDVSHMGRFTVSGLDSADFLEKLVSTRVRKQPEGKAFYTLLLNDNAGIIDDLIIMRLAESEFMLVVNAANIDTDLKHIREHSDSGVKIEDLTDSTVMVAVQGPNAAGSLQPITQLDLSLLKRFRCAETRVLGQPSLVSRTGYTGEDGFEVIIRNATQQSHDSAMEIWEKLTLSSTPCGLGARDSLRLEAGFPLHGSDMDQRTDPFQADLGWVISIGKEDYVGSAEVERLRGSPPRTIRRGLVLERGIPRHGFDVLDETGSAIGTVTSGTFSPLLRQGVALCMVNHDSSEFGQGVKVAVRDTFEAGKLAKPPFYDENLYGWKRFAQH